MARKNIEPTLSKNDRLQVRAFQMLYDLRKLEQGCDIAFASAVTDTSDEVFQRAIRRRPEMINQWEREFLSRRKGIAI